jgi:maltose/moltooligosaccharide transporter
MDTPDPAAVVPAGIDNADIPAPAVGSEWLRAALVYSVANLGAGFFYGFNNATLPLILNRFTENPLLIGLLSSTRSIEGAIVQPIVGAWSDRTWTRLGRRRPFMAIGIPLSALFFILAAHAPNLVVLVLAIVLFSLLFNIAADPYNALLADLFAPERRSAVTGVTTVIQFAGTFAIILGGAALASRNQLTLTFYLVAIGMLVTFAVTIVAIREPRHLRRYDAAEEPTEHRSPREYSAHLLRHRTAFRYLLCLFCYRFGGNAILPYLTLFATHVIHTSDAVAQYLFLGLVLATGVAVLPAGLLAAKTGRQPVLLAGIVLTVVAAFAGLFIQHTPEALVVIVLAGIANAGITATDWPLLTELIPADETGVFAGLKTAFESVALPASVILTGKLIEQWGYRTIFGVVVVSGLAAFALLRTVTVPTTPSTGTPAARAAIH